jgi:hypothetical protein
MKTIRNTVFITVIAALAAGCFSPLNSDENASISITLPGGGGTGKTAVDKAALTYELLFSGPDDAVEQRSGLPGETVTVRVVPGLWKITVKAFDTTALSILKAIGESSLDVRLDADNRVSVKMATYTEVSDWTALKTAMEDGTDDDFIVVTGNISAAGGTITLSADKTVTIVAETDVTVTRNFAASMLSVGAGSLILGSPAYTGTITLDGNNISAAGPLVMINAAGSFTMDGGTIKNNNRTDSGSGGGVEVSANGSFTMNEGTIKNNSHNAAGGFGGGGVAVTSGASFTMNGGTIDGNTDASFGGGVSVAGTFTMNGGTISDNEATASYGGGYGGGVEVIALGSFTMNGGSIVNNAAGNRGGGVDVESYGSFTMNGGTISDNEAPDGGGVWVSNAGGGIFITMNGGTISDNEAASSGGGVYVDSGSFNMTNGNIVGNKTSMSTGSGGGVYVNNGTFTTNGGTISDNEAASSGGGVYVNNGTFTMNGGTIDDNEAFVFGGGVCVGGSGSFNKSGGIIYGDTDSIHTPGTNENTARAGGHAAYVITGPKQRDSTAGPGDNLDSGTADGGWD